MQRIFADDARQAEFERCGFVVARLLSPDAAAELRGRIDDLRGSIALGASCTTDIDQSFCNSSAEYRQRMELLCGPAIEQPLLSLIPNYRLLGTGVMIKQPGTGAMNIHRDRTILEDPEIAPIAAWCPLVDMDDDFGNLSMLPGSHKLASIETPGLPRFYSTFGDKLKALCVTRPLRAGEAILFDYRLLHWAMPNLRDEERPVLRSTAVPIGQPSVYFRVEENSGGARLEIFDISDVGDHSPDEVEHVLGRARRLGCIDNSNREIAFEEYRRAAAEAGGTVPVSAFGRLRSALAGIRGTRAA